MKKLILPGVILFLFVSVFGLIYLKAASKNKPETQANKNTEEEAEQAQEQASTIGTALSVLVYRNTQYGFDFMLPESWKNFKIVMDKWDGMPSGSEKVVSSGPIVLIRHPQWTKEKPRQDIPIMVFTISQWNDLQGGKFHIGAAPIGPSELGRNSKYVFALPARYNYAYLTGYEEVESILKDKPLHPTETFSSK